MAFVAGGNAWALDPQSGDATCLFPAPTPGPFTWNPRGDRALLSDLEIASIDGEQLRAGTSPSPAVTSWGHPIGEAVVYVSPSGTRLRKIYPGTQRHDDITPIHGVHYLNVIYPPSGLAIAFVVDTGERQEIWLSSNVGKDPVRLVHAVGGTTFGALAFTADGGTLLYAAVHADEAPLLHALDLRNPTINQGWWHGDAGDRILSIETQPRRDGQLIAMTVGAACEDSRAMVFRRGDPPQALADAPSRVVGWLDGHTVLVATDGCTRRRTSSRWTSPDRLRSRSSRAWMWPPRARRSSGSCRRSPRGSSRRWGRASADDGRGGRSAADEHGGIDADAPYRPGLPATNTDAKAVATTPAIGAANAAIGIVVGSAPVTMLGAKMLASATTAQMLAIAMVKPIHNDRPVSGVLRLKDMSTSPVAIAAYSQSPNAAIGRCSCCEPVIMSGDQMLATATAIQMLATTMPANR